MAVLLSDIAKKTGFSVNTVSRVLRGDKRISSGTSELIRTAAVELGYVPNYVAGSMRCHETHLIGVISADSSNPFFAEVILGIEVTAKKLGYNILLMNTEENPENERNAITILQGRQVDGLVSIPLYNDEKTKTAYEGLSQPYVFAGRKVLGLEDHSILHDDTGSTLEVVQYFIRNGHRKILYLEGPETISNSLERLDGYVRACKESQIPVSPSMIVKTEGHIDDGYAAVNQILKLQQGFTAVVCFNDLVAMGALKALLEHNLSVPDDVEVFGCDNLAIAQYMQPRLSTIEVPKFRLGELAVTELVKHIKTYEYPYRTISLGTRMIFRESTRSRNIHSKRGNL